MRARRSDVVLGAAALCLLGACSKTKEPGGAEGDKDASHSATPARDASTDASRGSHRAIEWTLDPDDPARDYVGRYLRATLRYGADTSCVLLSPSSYKNAQSVVEVRNPTDNTCGKPGVLRETFLADVARDRLKVDDPSHGPALRPWPDGSAPDGPENAIVDIQDLTHWRSPLREAMKKRDVYPLRVQLFGRGTYPVVSLAGWHALFDPKGDVNALKDAARELCADNSGSPLAFVAGEGVIDLVLRIDCPANPHWEHL